MVVLRSRLHTRTLTLRAAPSEHREPCARTSIGGRSEARSRLYADPTSIRRVVADAGLPTAAINLTGSVRDQWFAVLEAATKSSDGIARILSVAHGENPSDAELARFMESTCETPDTLPPWGRVALR
ncbi:MAG: effector-associated domain EAD1-containing protein [Polyangiales bacterium]